MPQALLNFHRYNRNKELKEYQNGNILSSSYYFRMIIFFLMLLVSVIFGIFIILNWMKGINQLSISKVVITGERYYTHDDNIKKAILGLCIPNAFIDIDVNLIQNQIKSIPWIKQVTVHKQWPGKLNVHLVEYRPYAKWNDIFFINAEGSIFSLPSLINIKSNLLMLYGPEGSQYEILEMYHFMQQQLAPHKFNIKSVLMTARHAWQLVLDNDIRLNIGKVDIKARLNRFIELYPILKQVKDKRIEYIDLRYATGAAVGWLPILKESSVP